MGIAFHPQARTWLVSIHTHLAFDKIKVGRNGADPVCKVIGPFPITNEKPRTYQTGPRHDCSTVPYIIGNVGATRFHLASPFREAQKHLR